MGLYLLLIGHLFGDFFIRDNNPIHKQKKSLQTLLRQSFIYFLCLVLTASLFLEPFVALYFSLVLAIIHLGLHYLYVLYLDTNVQVRTRLKGHIILYIIKQLVLVFFILLLLQPHQLVLKNWVLDFLDRYIMMPSLIVLVQRFKLIFLYLFLLCPTSKLIKHLLNYYFYRSYISTHVESDEEENVGSLIGYLARVIIFTLCVMGLHASIALVITAKSLARFKQLNDKGFAERYLIGTLLS